MTAIIIIIVIIINTDYRVSPTESFRAIFTCQTSYLYNYFNYTYSLVGAALLTKLLLKS